MATNGTESPKWEGGIVLFAGGTDWAQVGRVGGTKKKSDAEKAAENERKELYPDLNSPVRLKSLLDVKIKFIASGPSACHCIAGDVNGVCYTWGRNEKGQLGHGDLITRNVPAIVKGLSGKKTVTGSGGKNHSAVATADGESYTFGSNLTGQCGTGSIKSKEKNEELLLSPFRVDAIAGCTLVACGADFTMWLCNGKVYSAGNPQYGQLGHGTDHEYNAKESSVKIMYMPQPTPKAIQSIAGKTITKLACGPNHTVALDDKQACYTWGNGGYGRLGHSVQQDEFAPRQVMTLTGRMPVEPNSIFYYVAGPKPAIVQNSSAQSVTLCHVAAGTTSSFCCMVGNQLVAWGKLKVSGDNTMYPKPMMELAGWNVRSLACGANTYAAACTSGEEHATVTWGQALHGELGYGPNGRKSAANPDKVLSMDGIYTEQVAMGLAHTLFLVDPKDERLEKFDIFEPAIAMEESPIVENGNGGKGKAPAGKRKAAAEPKAAKGRAKKK